MDELTKDKDLHETLQQAVNEANKAVSRAESIKRFAVLPIDLTIASGHLTPKLSIKRNVVVHDFAQEIESLYS